jgi:hypothetical protein
MRGWFLVTALLTIWLLHYCDPPAQAQFVPTSDTTARNRASTALAGVNFGGL